MYVASGILTNVIESAVLRLFLSQDRMPVHCSSIMPCNADVGNVETYDQ